jgi:5'-AMP-activated protein kinase catalytic alpha subunit
MEYAEGGDLFDAIMKKGPLREAQARAHFLALLSSLSALHSAGWCHRDIKLENILLDSDGSALLADFGECAKFNDQVSGPSLLSGPCGSPSYIAPEVSLGEAYDGPKADLWAAGIVLYAMVAAEFPFAVASSHGCPRYQRFALGEHSWPTHFSPELVDFLSCLLVTVEERPDSVEALMTHKWLCAA